MAFRKKIRSILKFKPDILIVPECEHSDKLVFPKRLKPSGMVWYGLNRHKGIGIFSFSGYNLKLLSIHNPEIEIVLPIEVTGDNITFTLFAIWAGPTVDRKFQYIGQVWKAIHYYSNLLLQDKVILAGDFNSNTFWDKPKRKWNHSDVVRLLEEKNIYSAYHKYYKSSHGKEKHNTLFMYRHKDKPYHIDYCFASDYFSRNIREVKVGAHHHWKKHSDHTPLMVTFSL